MSEFEKVLSEIGEFGPHQIRLFLLVSAFETPAAWAMLLPVFAAAKPSWRCPISEVSLSDGHKNGTTYNYTENACTSDGDLCAGYEYTSDFTSIVSEWNLVCSRDHIASVITTIQMIGVLVGACITGQLADVYGRRRIFYAVYTLLLLFGFVTSFANSWQLYAALRFFVGAFFGGTMVINFVLPLEFVGKQWRTFCGCIGFWACGVMSQALMAYYIRDWRHLSVASSAGGVLLVFTYWWVPESPRWLLQKGRLAEAEIIIKDIARVNKRLVPDLDNLRVSVLEESRIRQISAQKYSYWDLFRTVSMSRTSLIMMYAWFVSSSVYYGTSLNVGNLSGNRYLNFFLSGLVEIPALIFVVLVNNRLGRRRTMCMLMLIGGGSCFSILFLDVAEKLEAWKYVTTTLAMIGRSGIAGGWAATQVFSAEVFPTVIRNIGIGSCSMSARIGGIIAPQIVFLNEFSKPLPFIVFGSLAGLCGILAFFLPETLNKPLPDKLPPRDCCLCCCYDMSRDNTLVHINGHITKENTASDISPEEEDLVS